MKYIIEKDDEGVRLDRYLRKKLKSTPLTEIFKAMRIGKIITLICILAMTLTVFAGCG